MNNAILLLLLGAGLAWAVALTLPRLPNPGVLLLTFGLCALLGLFLPLPVCAADWNKPGANPFMLSVPAAVDSYPQIPPELRLVLKIKMEKRQPDDVVVITRDGIVGQGGQRYGGLRDMHWGGKAAPHLGAVDRSAWAESDVQRAFVYRAGPWNILVPFVCRNVALVDLLENEEKPAAVPGPVSVAEAPPLVEDAPTFLASSDVEAGEISGAGPIYLPASVTYLTGAPLIVQVLAPSTPVAGGLPPVGELPPGGVPVSPVPEPETYALMAAGLAALVVFKRRAKA